MTGRPQVVVRVRGGLGNQMFQYAMGKALALRHGCSFALHVPILKTHADRPYALDCFTARAPLASVWDFRAFTGGLLAWPLVRKGKHPQAWKERGHNVDPTLLRAKPPLYLDGFWQTEKYFRDYRSELLRDFTWRSAPEGSNRAALDQIETSESIAVHVRRGDYVANPDALSHHGVLGVRYYEAALRLALQRSPNAVFFVFSDDMPWAREHLGPLADCRFVDQNSSAASEDLRLMSACKHQIIANSSFSWWGAWLNSNADKLVIAPTNWLTKPATAFQDVYADGWITL